MTQWGEYPGAPGPGFAIPHPPAHVPYPEMDEAVARSLLTGNGVELTPQGLLGALDAEIEVIQGAAARICGEDGVREAIPRLREIAGGTGDSARVDAGYALALLGEPDGQTALRAILELPIQAYVAPMQAAGALARLGDPSGATVIHRGLRAGNELIRMVACKQLYFFAALDGTELPEGGTLDAYALFERALRDRDSEVVRQAEVQLAELDEPRARALLAGRH
jgi:HEAT repeat protein